MKPDHKRKQEPTPAKPAEGENTVASSGDNRRAGDIDGNRSAGDAKAPGPKSPETE